MKLFLRNYFLLALITLLTLFSCVEKGTTDSNTPPSAPSLAIDYDISGNFYIALTNTPLVLTQKTDFGSQSNFSVSPTLPSGLSLDITNGNISGTPTNSSLPTPYTVTATVDGKTYTKAISLAVAPSQVWVTNTNSANPYQLTAFVEGDRSKQITDWIWGSSDETFATVNNGVVSFLASATGGTVVISAVKGSYSNGMSLTVDKVKEVNGEKIITKGTDVSLIISSGTTTITNNQFQNQGLTRVVIPNSVTYIDSYPFFNNKLVSVMIPNSVTAIGDSAFLQNKLTSLVIPNSVTAIGNSAFYDNQLTNLVIGTGVTYIDTFTFTQNLLTSVVIPNNVTNIGNSAFRANQLTNVVIPNSVTYIDDEAFANNQLTKLVISDSVASIGDRAFTSNPNLVEVSLKQSLYDSLSSSYRVDVFGSQVTNYIKRP